MDDTTTLRLLAFVHPAWMISTLAMAVVTARLGLEIRRRRLSDRRVGGDLRVRHLSFGKRTLAMVGIGFLAGPVSMALLRDQNPFESFHGILGIIVLGLFAWTGWSGRALARGNRDARDIHRIAAASSVAAAMLSAVAGFILLP
jgi:hypothetical protein